MDDNIDILFAGDFAPCKKYESIVLSKKEKIFGDALSTIKSADIAFVNLECPLTSNNFAIPKSGPSLSASPSCIGALKDFTVIGLANNHILDYGYDGLKDTLNACEKINKKTIGAGLTLEDAQIPFITEIKGVKIALIALAEHEFNQSNCGNAGSAPIDPIDNYKQINLAKKEADIVIVTLHGGVEYFPYPRPGLRKLCKHYIDLGVNAVICHHPHVPGAYEYYDGCPIIYSLGNLIFDSSKPPVDWEFGYMVQLNFSKKYKKLSSLKLIPYQQSVYLKGLKLLNGIEKIIFINKIELLRTTLEDNQEYLNIWSEFVDKKSKSFLFRQYFPFTFKGVGFLLRKFPLLNLLINKSNVLTKLNMLRCQSHHELLISILEKIKAK